MTGAWYATIYGAATSYRHLRFEPPAVTSAAPAGEGQRVQEAGYRSALDAALGYASGRPS
jgi:hypothetical protein